MNHFFLRHVFKEEIYFREGSRRWRCKACNEVVRMDDREYHTKLGSHEENIRKRLDLFRSILSNWSLFEKYSSRIDEIQCPSWRKEMLGILFGQIFQFDSVDETIISKTLKKFEIMEQISILELSVWKENCILDHEEYDIGVFRAYTWFRRGWKSNKGRTGESGNSWKSSKDEARHSHNNIAIVISQVVPFLISKDSARISSFL